MHTGDTSTVVVEPTRATGARSYQPKRPIAGLLALAGLIASLIVSCSSQPEEAASCDHGWLSTVVDGDKLCVPDYPVWGVGPTKPTGLKDNGDGTMIHALTGLLWQIDVGAARFTWSDAATHCQALNLGGHSDWRLPSAAELSSIIPYWSYESGDAPVPPPSFHSALVVYWSASPDRTCAECAHSSFEYGLGGGSVKSAEFAVRCVSGTTPLKEPTDRFSFPTAQTVFDASSNLTWQRIPNATMVTFDEAQAFCANNFGKLPGTGWRLPKLREAETILGRYESRPGAPLRMKPVDHKLPFWTSTVSAPALLSDTHANVYYRADFLRSSIANECASWPGIQCPTTARVVCVR